MNRKEELKVRKGFEEWALSGSRFYPIDKAADESYFNALTDEAWKAWKAAVLWTLT